MAQKQRPTKTKIDRLIESEPIVVAGKRVQLIAHLQGWATESSSLDHAFGASVGRLAPTEVRVEETGSSTVVAINDPHRATLEQMARFGAAVSACCLVTILAIRIVTLRR